MPAGFIGHQPERVEVLHARVCAVVEDLLTVGSDEPAAAGALGGVRRVRSHLESMWLPLLDRICASTAMTSPFAPRPLHALSMLSSPPSTDDDDVMRPPSSAEVAADLIEAADEPAERADAGRRDQPVLSNGWSWGCGPVSATTGQPVSGCEFMPPTRWDVITPTVLVASVLPVTGELVDAYDCIVGAIPCEAILIPFISGRSGHAVDDLLDAAGITATAPRSIDDILVPNGVSLGRAGSRPEFREVTGTLADAEAAFVELSRGGELVLARADHILVRLPDGGYVGLRTKMSALSPNTNATIDVNIEGCEIKKVKYNR